MVTKPFAIVIVTCISVISLTIVGLTFTKGFTEEAEQRAYDVGSENIVCSHRLEKIKETLSVDEKAFIPRQCFADDGNLRFQMPGEGRYILKTETGFVRTTA